MSADEKRTFSGSHDGCPSPSEPVVKKIRCENNSIENSKVESSSSNEPTILDVLDEKCWRVVFSYVHLQDLLDTETVSKEWRSVIHRYLKGIRVSLRHDQYVNWWYEHPMNSHIVYVPDYYLEDAVKKFGRSVVGAFCGYYGDLDTLVDYCPDLEDLKVIRPDSDYLLFEENRVTELKKLKRVSFQVAIHFSDADVISFIGSPVLEELVVNYNRALTGRFVRALKSKLTALQLDGCKKLNIGNLVSCAYLTDLIKLGLNRNPTVTLRNAYKLIEKTPKLECLTFEVYEYPTDVGGLVNAICRLSQLSHLSFLNNINVYDDWLEPIGRCCKALRYVNVGKCKNVTAAGVMALCRGAGNTLARLDVSGNDHVTDDDVASYIRACPRLERLDVPLGRRLTPALAAAAAAALGASGPRPRLRLRLSFTSEYTQLIEDTAELILDWSENDDPTAWDHHYLAALPPSLSQVSHFDIFYRDYRFKC